MSSLARNKAVGAKLVRGGKSSGRKALSSTDGVGHLANGRLMEDKVGSKLVRKGKAAGVGARNPKVNLVDNPLSKAFSQPGAGIPQIKGSGGKGGKV